MEDLFNEEVSFSDREVEDSTRSVERLRDRSQVESAEGFLREIVAWAKPMRSSRPRRHKKACPPLTRNRKHFRFIDEIELAPAYEGVIVMDPAWRPSLVGS